MDSSQNIRLAVPFFIVRDMQASINFYVDKLDFKITNQWTPHGSIEWCWLQRDSVALMLQQPSKKEHWIYNLNEAGKGISICFQCDDALALYNEFAAKEVKMQEPFVGNNMWVVGLNDPDEYRLEFENITDVAEETTYSQWIKQSQQ